MRRTENSNGCPSIFHNTFADPFLIERILLIIYTGIFFVGLVGNLMTIIIIKYNKHLRTPTNFYLLNLAVSDLMILMCNLPLEMIEIHYRQWPLSIVFCRLRNISAEFFTCSSILTIFAFTCERYFAIVHPIHFHQLSHFRRAQKIILAIWLISLIFSVPFGFSYQIDSYSPLRNDLQEDEIANEEIVCRSCVPKKSIEKLLSIVIIITSFVFFYLPMLIIGAIYFFIGKALQQVDEYENPHRQMEFSCSSLSSVTRKPLNYTSSNSSLINKVASDGKPSNNHVGSYSWMKTRARFQARRVVVKTLVAVVIAFFVCYAPLYLQRLLLAIMELNASLTADAPIFSKIIAYLYVISGTTFYFGSVINPILYNAVSNKYRRAFRDLFCCRLTCKTKSSRQNSHQSYHRRRSPHQAVHYFVRKSPLTPPSPLSTRSNPLKNKFDCHSDQERQSGNQEEILPNISRALPRHSQSSRSNSSSISSSQRENYSNHSRHSHASLTQECQVFQQKKFSLRRQLLLSKQPTDTVPWLLTKNRA